MSDQGISTATVQNQAIEKAWENAGKLRNSQEVLDNETELYRHYDAWNRLLYVGISCSSVARLSNHMYDSDWRRLVAMIKIERWPTRELALIAEKQAIRNEMPYFNKAHNRSRRKWSRPTGQKRHAEYCGDRSCSGCEHTPGES